MAKDNRLKEDGDDLFFNSYPKYQVWLEGHPNCSCSWDNYSGLVFQHIDCQEHGANPKNQETPKNRGNDLGATATQVGGSHYTKWAIQPIEFIVKNAVPYREANVIKYTMRHRDKNGAEDIRKAIHYLEMILEDYEP